MEIVEEIAKSYLDCLKFFEETKKIKSIKPSLTEMFHVKEAEAEIKFLIRVSKEPALELVQ